MADYNINLIRVDVLPAHRRRSIFWTTTACILLAGLAVVYAANRVARKIAAAMDDREHITSLEQRFADDYPGKDGILEYGEALRDDLVQESAALSTIDHVMKSQTHLSGLLLWLAESLPNRYYVLNFSLDRAKSTLTFDIAGPANRSSDSLRSTDLIKGWSANEELMSWVSTIQLVLTRRQEIGRRNVFVWNFKAVLKGRGA